MSPCHYRDYPRNWRSEIRPRILLRAGEVRGLQGQIVREAHCEQCGVENHSVGVRDVHGEWQTAEQIAEGSLYSDDREYRLTRIVLTVAHLDHDYANARVSDDRLRAWCQRCHLKYDHREHVEHARQTRERKTGQLTLGLVALLFVLVVPALADPPQTRVPAGGMETTITWSSAPASTAFLFPIAEQDYQALTSLFGARESPFETLRVVASHSGIDISTRVPRAQVIAVADGAVDEWWPPPGKPAPEGGLYKGHDIYGGMILLDHGGGVKTRYAHLSETNLSGYARGRRIKAGDIIGRVGNTGKSIREHLHFEVIVEGVLQNPLLYLELPQGGRRQ